MEIGTRIACVVLGLSLISVPYCLKKEYEKKITKLDSVTQSIQTTYTKEQHYSGRRHRHTVYIPRYHFIVGKTQYVCIPLYTSSSIPTNEPKNIYYNSKNPIDCMPENEPNADIKYYVQLVIGVIAILIGFLYKEK